VDSLTGQIVEGTEIIISGNVGPGLDPEPHCQTLLSAPEPHVSDVVLTSHARLVHTLREWFVQRQAIHRNSAGSTEATRQMQHLTMNVNARLEWWHDDLKAQPRLRAIPPQAMRETVLFWQFARAVVNEIGAAALQAQPRLRASRVMESVDGAMEFLELCAAWEPKMDLANLPQNYLHVSETPRPFPLLSTSWIPPEFIWSVVVSPHPFSPLHGSGDRGNAATTERGDDATEKWDHHSDTF
jgi:hypothetical protein